MTLVKVLKQVEMMRDDRCESLVDESSSFYEKHIINIPKINDMFVIHDRSRRNRLTYLHH
jgi:hypothetical protein